MEKLYLLTGATGHLGLTLTRKILARGGAVRALVLPGEEHLVPPGVEVVTGDVTDPASLVPFFRTEGFHPVTLLHCAAIISIASRESPALWRTNVTGTANILRLARQHGVDRMIYVSSVHAIPEQPYPAVIREVDAFSLALVSGQYARSKAAAGNLVLRAAAEGLPVSIVHPSGILGPGDSRGENHMIRTIRATAAGKFPVSIRGGYDFVDVRDVAEGILLCEERGRSGECYILSGHYLTIRQMMETVCRLTGRRAPVAELPAAAAKLVAPVAEAFSLLAGRRKPLITPYSIAALQTNARFSHEKATRELGYHPRDMTESLRDSLAF